MSLEGDRARGKLDGFLLERYILLELFALQLVLSPSVLLLDVEGGVHLGMSDNHIYQVLGVMRCLLDLNQRTDRLRKGINVQSAKTREDYRLPDVLHLILAATWTAMLNVFELCLLVWTCSCGVLDLQSLILEIKLISHPTMRSKYLKLNSIAQPCSRGLAEEA